MLGDTSYIRKLRADNKMGVPDLTQRDPNSINGHIQVQFDDVLAEPDGAHSIDCVWTNSYKCFECGKNLCYKLLTTLCGICIALFWGCDFAMLAFNHVWCATPCMRDFAIGIGCMTKFVRAWLDCCCAPVCESCGALFSRMRLQRV